MDIIKGPGAFLLDGGRCLFRVWAPDHDSVSIRLISPTSRVELLNKTASGYHEAVVEGVGEGQQYLYILGDGLERADPTSRSQPAGVHGASEVVGGEYTWADADWANPPLRDYIIYELHVGTFTPEGTFAAVIPHLADLKDLGITAIELMPIAQFPGGRNWGYDGVFPFAAQSTYGGLAGLKKLVNACHENGIAVVLDVVYNHLGPEGNYFRDLGPYFSKNYSTPWGEPINFDGRGSDEVRRYFIDNALQWTDECHIDALRLDAIHAIYDFSARPFLAELSDAVHARAAELGRQVYLIAESALNDPKVVWPTADGGLGMDAHWNDDYHHAVRVALTGDRRSYYVDFDGLPDVQTAIEDGYVYQGQHSAFRGRRHGSVPAKIKPEQLVVFSQNHDQIGNRPTGDRLTDSVDFESLKLVAGLTLMAPFVPLLFMGEEYAEPAPFPYFISHTDPGLVEAVRKGRSEEFPDFRLAGGQVPDPQDEQTFLGAKLNHSLRRTGMHRVMWDFYRELIRLRREHPALQGRSFEDTETSITGESEDVLRMMRRSSEHQVLCLFNFGHRPVELPVEQLWLNNEPLIYSAAPVWGGNAEAKPARNPGRDRLNIKLATRSFVVLTSGDGSDC